MTFLTDPTDSIRTFMKRILIIDDDDEIRLILRQLLEQAGYKVEEASDGKEGISLHRQKTADLIITDMIMPKKEGMETIMELRTDFPHVKIIAMSGGGRIGPENYLQMAEAFGALNIFKKPFNLEDMLGAVRELLEVH